MKLRFEWNARKAQANPAGHGVSFEEAASVFNDPLACTFAGPGHCVGEERRSTPGVCASGRLLAVISTEPADALRIAGAHPSTRHERASMSSGTHSITPPTR